MSHIGKCTKIALIRADRSQAWLAMKLETSHQQASRICLNPDAKNSVVEKLAGIFGMSPGEFTALSPDPVKQEQA